MITTAILTVAGGAIWEALSPKIIESAHASAKSKWSKFKWSASFETYKNRLIEQYSTTKLLGNPKPIRIDHIYTDVYVLDKITAYRRLEIDKKSGQLKEFSSIPEATKRFPLLDIARDHSRIYVLGKPGAGKSTFLKKVCLLCCNGTIPKTPIFISLKEWYDSEIEIEKFIADEFAACGFPDAELFIDTLLQSGSAILLLDGLDEIPPDNDSRQKAITALTRFTRKNSSTQVILTCRIAAAEYSFDQFKYYEIADFTPEQQKHFTQKWYDNNENASAKFNEQWNIKENNGLRELARTPLLLALLCLAFDETLSFPKRRVDLYSEASNALLRKWDSTRGIRRDNIYRSLSHTRKEQLLSRLAAKSFQASRIFFSQDYANTIIEEFLEQLPPRDDTKTSDPITILKSIEAQHGLLIERAASIYSFSHLSLHEYFTAKYLIGASHSHELDSVVQNHYFEDSWREVFLMIASLLDDATPLFKSIETLFHNKFFKSDEVRKLVFYSSLSTPYKSLSKDEIKWMKNIFIQDESAEPTLAKIEDLCLTLASQFHFIQCGEIARSRVRSAITHFNNIAIKLINTPKPSKQALKPIINYLQACIVIIESMQLASISERDSIVESLIFPNLKSTFSDFQ